VAGLGAPELLIILLIIMLIFGGAKLPKLARSLGESSKEFKKGLNEGAGAATAEPEQPKPDTNKTDTSQS
jgi:sec-independent protein translocase protein TatA